MAVPSPRWGKGVSGNPLGRPKKWKEITKLAQDHSVEAMERIFEIMRNKKASTLSLRACEIILDRAFGKVPQAITGAGGEGPISVQVSWKSAEVATVDITPRETGPLLLEAQEVDDGA